MRLIWLVILIFLSTSLLAQKWTPNLTEQWEPVPVVVTPGESTEAPSDAIVLFDGSNLNAWESADGKEPRWNLSDGAITVVRGRGIIRTREKFSDVQLHIEWRTPAKVKGKGQGRGNSGVFLQERYEIQVLDSYDNATYSNGQAASIYKQHIPMVNASKGPGEWQTYDIIFQAPVFEKNGTLVRPAAVTLLHNGILALNHVLLEGNTEYIGLPGYEQHGPASIVLQDHGNPVSYRNIWVRKL